MVVLHKMNQVRCFLGISVQRAAEFLCEDFRQRVQSATICFKQTVFTWEESALLTYAWAWKTQPPVKSKDRGGFSLSDCGGPMDNDSASCFVWNDNVPSVHWCLWELFWGASFVVKTKKDSLTDNHTGANCDQRWHKSSIHTVGGRNEVDTITQKKI